MQQESASSVTSSTTAGTGERMRPPPPRGGTTLGNEEWLQAAQGPYDEFVQQVPPPAPDAPPVPEPPPYDENVLGKAGAATCEVVVTDAPWDLGAEALVVAVGLRGFGGLGRAFGSATGIDLLELLSGVAAPPDVLPDEPVALRVETPGGLRWVFAASSRLAPVTRAGKRAATPEGAARAAAACVRAAAHRRVTTLALPLLGTGTAGLDRAPVAEALVPAVQAALRELGKDSPLRRVVLFVQEPDTATLVREAWRGYRSQPFANDRPDGRDLLGIRAEVEALADMLLLRDVQPPLAVGVLGGWGSGKSFVMHLMRDRLNEVRAESLTEEQCWEGEGVSPFVGHIYPIEFNAWTYARADLWAALMQTTLTELDRQLGLERLLKDAGQDLRDGAEWQRLRDVPEALQQTYTEKTVPPPQSTEDLFAVLNEVHKTQRDKLKTAQEELAKHRAEEAQAERAVEDGVDAAIDVRVDAARWAPFRTLLGSAVGATGKDVEKWLARELPKSKGAGDDAQAVTQDARRVAVALRSLRPPDRQVAKSVVKRHWFAAFVFVAATLAAPFLIAQARQRLDEYTLPTGFVATVAALASFARLAKGWSAVVGRFADHLTAWQRSVEEDVRRVEETRAERLEVAKRADDNLAAVRAKIARAEREVESLRKEVGLIGEFRSVNALVKERLEQGTYQQRLGVMQQISEDLSSISRSLTTRDKDEHADEKRLLFPRGPARVVLFIDDLDRCPPAKVVEVLEAIQLLLATDLFVVVVAIDVRYVTKALEKVYEGVLDADGEPSGVDYLEKIIQIPYRTRSLTARAARDFLGGQLRVVEDPAEAEAAAAAGGATTSPGDDAVAAPPRKAEAVARDLVFQPEELDVLSVCCAVLGLSPRAGKRIGNVAKLYRLVSARRGRPTPTLDDIGAVALFAGLAAAHPEVQRDALVHVTGLARTNAPGSLVDALLLLPPPGADSTARWTARHEAWRASVELARDTPVFAAGEHRTFRIGGARLAAVAPAVDFVAAFCFVADVSGGTP